MSKLLSKLRMWQWVLVAITTTAGIYFLAPEQLGILLLKTCYIATAVVVGYYADRVIFYYSRPHEVQRNMYSALNCSNCYDPAHHSLVFATAMAQIRRAIVVASVVIGFAIAL